MVIENALQNLENYNTNDSNKINNLPVLEEVKEEFEVSPDIIDQYSMPESEMRLHSSHFTLFKK